MIMKFEISSEVNLAGITEKTVTGKDGKEYLIREQVGWVDLGKPYPQEVRIPIQKGRDKYEPGKYLIDPACLYVDRYGQLSLGRLRLIAVK
jgi:hypothetical protein